MRRICTLREGNNYPEAEEIRVVVVDAFGIGDASVCVVDWVAHRHLQQFAKAEEHLKSGVVWLPLK